MPNQIQEAKVSSNHFLFSVALIVAAIAAVVITAIFFRPGGFSVEGQGQGVTLKLAFNDSRIDLSDFLGQLFKKAENGTEADRDVLSGILQAHGFYLIPSRQAADKLREIKETETTRDFIHAVRSTLYDLQGPFQRPETFLDADDRVLDAIDDLYKQKPASPLVTKLWEMSLDFKGVFELRDVRISVLEDKSLSSGVAATCTGKVWLGHNGLIRMDDKGPGIGVRIGMPRPCAIPRVWLSPSDMNNLIGEETLGSGQELQAILTPLPMNLSADVQGQ
jgi:hypothetical protein